MNKNKIESNVINVENLNISRGSDSLFTFFTIDNRPSEYIDFSELRSFPRKIDGGGVCICLKGEFEITIDLKSYRVKEGDLLSVFPGMMLQPLNKSDDFVGYTLAISSNFMSSLQDFPSGTLTYLFIRENPCISLDASEQELIIKLCEDAMSKNKRMAHPYRREISMNLLTNICYEIAAIYKKGNPLPKLKINRKEDIFQRFLSLLANNFKQERSLQFYADQLCISQKYLSSVVKEVSGSSATNWVENIVILNAKSLLTHSLNTIQQISYELNFPNPSFFGQYFKKHTGMTPKQFRKSK